MIPSTLLRQHLSSSSLSESEDISPNKPQVGKDLKQFLFFFLYNYTSSCVTAECVIHDLYHVLLGVWQSLYKMGVIDTVSDFEEYFTNRSQHSYKWTRFLNQTFSDICGNCCIAPQETDGTPAMRRTQSLNVLQPPKSPPKAFKSSVSTRSRYEEEFEEIEKLGRGGYGSVYRVRNKLDGEEYAVKKVKLRSLDMSDKIFREVKTLARLDHQHVVRYYAAWLEYHNQLLLGPAYSASQLNNSGIDTFDTLDDDFFIRPERSGLMNPAGYFNGGEQALMRRRPSVTLSGPLLQHHHHSSHPNITSAPVHSPSDSLLDTSSTPLLAGAVAAGTGHAHSASAISPIASSKHNHSHSSSHKDKDNAEIVLYIQMQLCASTLQDWFERESRTVDRLENLRLFRQLLLGLQHIHAAGLVHRDCKPANVLIRLSSFGDMMELKIGDFGLAKDLRSDGKISLTASSDTNTSTSPLNTSSNNISNGHSPLATSLDREQHSNHTGRIGTRVYCAPEQEHRRGKEEYTSKADIYSLGIILFEFFYIFPTRMERSKVLTDLRKGTFPANFAEQWPFEARLIRNMMEQAPALRPATSELIRVIEGEILSLVAKGSV